MSFDRSALKQRYGRPAGFPYAKLQNTGDNIEGVYIGDEFAIRRDFVLGRPAGAKIARDGKVMTSTIIHLLVTDGNNYHDENLVGQRVKYEIKGGKDSLDKWKQLKSGDFIVGDTIRITRTGTHPQYNTAGVFEFQSKPATELSEEVEAAIDEVAANRKTRDELDTIAKRELGDYQQANTFTSPAPNSYAQGNGYSNNSFANYGADNRVTQTHGIKPF